MKRNIDFKVFYKMYSNPLEIEEYPKAGRIYAIKEGYIVRCVNEGDYPEYNKYEIYLTSPLDFTYKDGAEPNDLPHLTETQLELYWNLIRNKDTKATKTK